MYKIRIKIRYIFFCKLRNDIYIYIYVLETIIEKKLTKELIFLSVVSDGI